MFANHKGYIFHDSRGLEAGSDEELGIVRDFIRKRSGQRRLQDRLHAIWFTNLKFSRSQLLIVIFKGTASRWTTTDQSWI